MDLNEGVMLAVDKVPILRDRLFQDDNLVQRIFEIKSERALSEVEDDPDRSHIETA